MNKVSTYQVGQELFRDVAQLIDDTRESVAYTVNSALSQQLYQMERWSVRTLRQIHQIGKGKN